ncbi:MAG TPA: DUF86 domain-containing protein [Planctomycetes bacterium]|nr:DUF86 domain-containing protein [Planctomycetota bacterium]
MFKDDSVRIHHILDAAREAISFADGRSRTDLDTDRKLNLSVVRLLEIIGEAARGISEKFRDSHPDLPWNKMVGMRDRLIHGYFDVNLDVVWETVTQDLPSLITELEKIVAD